MLEETTETVANIDDMFANNVNPEPLPMTHTISHPIVVPRKRKSKVAVEDADKVVVNEKAETVETPFSIIGTFNSTHIKVLETSIAMNTPALLVGHTGLGKTTLIAELAKANGKKLVRLSVHSGVTADEILGKWLAENGSTVWQDGLLIQAMKAGNWIVFDEINACPADVLFALHSLLDDDRHVTLLEKKGEIVRPHADFRFFATMNPQDDYAGTKDVNMAFMSRFNAVLEIEPYIEEIEVGILMSKGLEKKLATALVSTANKLREMKSKDEIMYFCGTRDIINTGLMVKQGLKLDEAVIYGIVNKMSKDDKAFVGNKIPAMTFTNQYQKEIKRLNEALDSVTKKAEHDKQTFGDEVNLKNAIIVGLETQLKSCQGNQNLTPDTVKALKILGVLTK